MNNTKLCIIVKWKEKGTNINPADVQQNPLRGPVLVICWTKMTFMEEWGKKRKALLIESSKKTMEGTPQTCGCGTSSGHMRTKVVEALCGRKPRKSGSKGDG